jgi:hypothetical protein
MAGWKWRAPNAHKPRPWPLARRTRPSDDEAYEITAQTVRNPTLGGLPSATLPPTSSDVRSSRLTRIVWGLRGKRNPIVSSNLVTNRRRRACLSASFHCHSVAVTSAQCSR